MDTIISDAGTAFASTTGFSMSSVVSWMSDILVLWMGMGLSVLDSLKVWIGALVFIAIVVYFAYRAFRYFRG